MHAEEFIPTAEFKPVIPLPELVDVKTGEEGAEVLFEHRAKLLRFDTTAKEWKDRGIGIMKILKEKTIRFVMRREQVLKVCCNHQLLKGMIFDKMQTNASAVTWHAKDFSEGELKPELFALRFKTEELADKFLNAINSALKMLDDNNNVKKDFNAVEEKAEQDVEKKSDKKVKSTCEIGEFSPTSTKSSWGDKFKPKAGSWECKNCYIVNEGKCNYCVACDTPKNDTIPKKSTEFDSSGPQFSFGVKSPAQGNLFGTKQESPTPQTSFIFGKQSNEKPITSGWGDAFKPKEGSWACKDCYTRNDQEFSYCQACNASKDDTVPKKSPENTVNLDTGGLKFNFGIPSSNNTASKNTSSVQSLADFSFNSTKNESTSLNLATGKQTFSFKLDLPKIETSVAETSTPSSDKFVFGTPQKHSFEFKPRSPRRHSSGQGDEESDGSYVEDEGDSIYFKPVIPLPDKIEVKTGEEDEKVLYCQRAKLFRFTNGEWKERGLGDIKILRKIENGKVR